MNNFTAEILKILIIAIFFLVLNHSIKMNIKKILLLISFLNFSFAPAEASWPIPDFRSCDFYLKAEKILGCEKKGSDYLVGYGFHYCSRFKEESKNWNGKLKGWVENTGQCLQEMLYDNKEKRLDTCAHLEEFAFDAHPICYKQYGICDLSLNDYWQLKDLLRATDITNLMKNPRRSKTQINNVYDACTEKLEQRAEDTLFDLIADQLNTLSRKIKMLASDVFIFSPKEESKRNSYFKNALAIILYGESSLATNSAAELFHQQYTTQTGSFHEARTKTIGCFTALKSGESSPACDSAVALAYKKDSLKQKIDVPSPQITEQKLKQILKMNYKSK